MQTPGFWGDGKYGDGCDMSHVDVVVSSAGTVSEECSPWSIDKTSSSGGISAIWGCRVLFMEDSEDL